MLVHIVVLHHIVVNTNFYGIYHTVMVYTIWFIEKACSLLGNYGLRIFQIDICYFNSYESYLHKA
jgi:hypothetical protein